MPGEEFVEENFDGSLWKDGAFVYIYDDPQHDNFLCVGKPPDGFVPGAAPPEPFKLRIDVDHIGEEWKELFRLMGIKKSDFKDPATAKMIVESLEAVDELRDMPTLKGAPRDSSFCPFSLPFLLRLLLPVLLLLLLLRLLISPLHL